MAQLEIFQNGTSLHPDRMGDPVFQIRTKNADGSYEIVVSDGMAKEEAESKLEELQPTKDSPKKKSTSKKKVVKKDAAKKTAKEKTKKKKASGKKKVTSKKRKKK